MHKKKIVLVVVCFIILLGVWWLQIGYETPAAKGEAKVYSIEEAPISNKKNDGAMLQKGHQEMPDESSLFSPAEVAEYQEWLRSRGNFTGVRGSEYDSYDFATLHQLADSGDLHAMYKLAHLYISDAYHQQYGFKAAEDMLMRAALYGSSYALAEIADFKHSQRFSAASELDKRHLTIVSLAYFRAAELRGDYWGSITMRDPLLKINPIILEPEEKESIESSAQAIYTQLEAQRESMGLGEFDNSVPASVTKLFESLQGEELL